MVNYEGKNVVITGDYNIAHHPIDVYNPANCEGKSGYLPEERGVYPKTKIFDQLMYFAKLKGMIKFAKLTNFQLILSCELLVFRKIKHHVSGNADDIECKARCRTQKKICKASASCRARLHCKQRFFRIHLIG